MNNNNKIMESKEKINKLLDGANVMIIGTDKGVAAIGNGVSLMSVLSLIIDKLKEGGVPDDYLKIAFDVGMEADTNKVKTQKINNEIDKIVKEILKDIKKDLENILGDDTDE